MGAGNLHDAAAGQEAAEALAGGLGGQIGRYTSIAASLIVIATAGTLLLGALERFF